MLLRARSRPAVFPAPPPPIIIGGGSFVVALCVRGPVPRRRGAPPLDSRCLGPTYASADDVCVMYINIFLTPQLLVLAACVRTSTPDRFPGTSL